MRDIRSALQERLDAVAKNRSTLQAQLAELDHIETGIKALMQREAVLFITTSNGNGNQSDPDVGTPMAQFVLQALRRAQQPVSLEDLKKMAVEAGVDFGEKSPGRVLHYALV